MDFLLQKGSNNHRSVSASICSLLYTSLCKFVVKEFPDEAENQLVSLGENLGAKIPDLAVKHKQYPALEEKERYLLFALNDYWRFLTHKAAQVIERSDTCANECI